MIEETEIKQMIDQLADFRSAKDALDLQEADIIADINARRDTAIAKILTPEIKAQLDEINQAAHVECVALTAEVLDKIDAADTNAAALETAIKNAVARRGATVRGSVLMAVYTKPRVTWDGGGLEGFMVAHPEISAFRRVGEASVSFRAVGK